MFVSQKRTECCEVDNMSRLVLLEQLLRALGISGGDRQIFPDWLCQEIEQHTSDRLRSTAQRSTPPHRVSQNVNLEARSRSHT